MSDLNNFFKDEKNMKEIPLNNPNMTMHPFFYYFIPLSLITTTNVFFFYWLVIGLEKAINFDWYLTAPFLLISYLISRWFLATGKQIKEKSMVALGIHVIYLVACMLVLCLADFSWWFNVLFVLWFVARTIFLLSYFLSVWINTKDKNDDSFFII